ncbi:type III-A CRISPR-associated protein Csm2 [Roseofilum sp. BLCC_M91]|uniref:CRISPR system Cms protein Csm2 n=1 Tax=Roseofilum halophilum BLCC-M91 TaxID=3022259 RepID=A0ABT7BNE0_9CYAN|nr:type III-A CRISPR-associated protein Csm2 [Roseofilum halophilum]MDJ1180707.1 type III-A CRISPR-associated protein Csm2 [Roseofilum halophilum BLCC-M91]
MTQPPKPLNSRDRPNQHGHSPQHDITKEIIDTIQKLSTGLKDYPIRVLVNHAEKFGPELKKNRLETNQIRKFLDAINQIKSKLTQFHGDSTQESISFAKIEPEIVLLKPKLAYAAARQPAVKPLSKVMAAAIDKVNNTDDFERFVQLIESIIAYHKAAGGK